MKRFTLVTCLVLTLISLAFFAGCETTDVEPVSTQTAAKPAPSSQASQTPARKTTADLEYEKSVGSTGIAKKTFEEDKAVILQKVEELDLIMRQKDYKKWVTYLDDESLKYWQNKSNLQKTAARSPVKGLKLNTLEDYFNYIFIGSRVGRTVDQIRYVTDTQVNAVQAGANGDVVYYTFYKVNGEWKLHLRTLEEM